MRHFAPEAVGGPSLANVVEHNRVVETGETTAALGAISTTGVWHNAGLTNSVIRYNCVRDTIGFDKGNARPDETFGIYLDNEASGYDVHHNVIRNTQDGGFMVHYGHNNTVWNNVFANASLSGFELRDERESRERAHGEVGCYHRAEPGREVHVFYLGAAQRLDGLEDTQTRCLELLQLSTCSPTLW